MPKNSPENRLRFGDAIFRSFRMACAASVGLVCAGLLFVLFSWAQPALSRWSENGIFTSARWDPGQGMFGSLGFVYGSIVSCAIALAIAVPAGIASAAYLSELAPHRVRVLSSGLFELMAAVPSVVFGFWGKVILAPLVLDSLIALKIPGVSIGYGGQSLLTAGLVLALMILPFITTVSYTVFRKAPPQLREGAYALGATHWQVLVEVVWPHGKRAVIAGCFLALSRALGETMAVAMVVGNSDAFMCSLLAPGDTVPSTIAKNFTEVSGGQRHALVALGLLLVVATSLANLSAKWLAAWAAKPKTFRGGNHQNEMPSSYARGRYQRLERLSSVLLACCHWCALLPLILVLGTVAFRGCSGIRAELFTQLPQPFDHPGGLGHAIAGSAMMLGIAAGFAVPIGLGAGYYLAENRRKRSAGALRFAVEFLGGVPSIVLGIFGFALLVEPQWLDGQRWGFSAWAGAFALGLVMLPILVQSGETAFGVLSGGLREASFSLGASQWQTAWRLVFPTVWPALCAGILLAFGRASGEAAPLLLTSSGSNFWPGDPRLPTASLPYFLNDASHSIGRAEFERLGWVAAFLLATGAGAAHLAARRLLRARVSLRVSEMSRSTR